MLNKNNTRKQQNLPLFIQVVSKKEWHHKKTFLHCLSSGIVRCTFPPHSYTKLEKKYANYGQSCFVRSDLKKMKCVCKTQMVPPPDHKKL